MLAKYVRPHSKGQKNGFRDAEEIAEAVQRPTMKFVAIKNSFPVAGWISAALSCCGRGWSRSQIERHTWALKETTALRNFDRGYVSLGSNPVFRVFPLHVRLGAASGIPSGTVSSGTV
jgi:hypothetical protein